MLDDNQKSLVSILIGIEGIHDRLKDCVKSIQQHTPEPHEIIFLNNGPAAKGILNWARQSVSENANYQLLELDKNVDWAEAFNQGTRVTSAEFIVILHNDVIVSGGWLADMLHCLNHDSGIGIVGPMTNKADGIQDGIQEDINANYCSIDLFEAYAKKFHVQNRYRRVLVKNITGFCLVFRRKLIERIGNFDENFKTEKKAVEDFCFRTALIGYKIFVAADVHVHHYDRHKVDRDHSGKEQREAEDRKIFKEKLSRYGGENSVRKRLQAIKILEQADQLNQKGQVDQAVNALLGGIGASPDDERFYLALAGILISAGSHKDALDALKKMPAKEEINATNIDDKERCGAAGPAAKFPDSILLQDLGIRKLELYGYSEEGLGNYKGAEECADRALTLNPSSAAALNLKGILAFKQNNREGAQGSFKKALESDPGYGEPYTNLGALKWETEQEEEALELYERGFILDPTDPDIATIYYTAISTLGEFKRAESVVRGATAMHPHNRKIKYMLIDALIQQGQYDPAMSEIEAAMVKFGVDDNFLSAALKIRNMLGPKKTGKAKGRPAVSLCMIVKNEGQYLARCLASVKPIVDEMIVVDTGSTDRTKDIAKVFGADVYDFEWDDDFAEARNFSISKASGDWIFSLDADEVFSPLDYRQFKEIVKKSPNAPVAYSIVTRNYSAMANLVGWAPNDGKYTDEEAAIGWVASVKVRLFYGKDQIRFEGAVHEMVDPVLKRKGIRIKECSFPIHHYGRMNKGKVDRKGEIYFKIGKKKLAEIGDDISAIRELAVQATNMEKNEEAIELWHSFLSHRPNSRMAAEAFINMSAIYIRMKKLEEALSAAKKAIAHAPEQNEAMYNYALIELHLGNAEKTISVLEDLLARVTDYPPAQFILAAAHFCAGNKEKGLRGLNELKGTSFHPILAYSCAQLAQDLISAQRVEYASNLLGSAVECEIVNEDVLKDHLSLP